MEFIFILFCKTNQKGSIDYQVLLYHHYLYQLHLINLMQIILDPNFV